jgi:hypothetical protein
MLPVPGTQPLGPLQRPDDATLGLRLNQRLTAEVLKIATDHVVLALEGVSVVARLTSPEQAAMLAERRMAQFVVRGFSGQTLTLQLADPAGANRPALSQPPDLVAGLLRQSGLPADEATLLIARALLDHGLPVTAELVDELAQALAALENWGTKEAQQAAALKAEGLPLTSGALALARAGTTLPESLSRLENLLRAFAQSPLPPRLAELAQNALETLSRARLHLSPDRGEIVTQLRELAEVLGRTLEHDLAALSKATSLAEQAPHMGLLGLAQLRGELAALTGQSPEAAALAAGLDQFLDAAKLSQLKNVAPTPVPAEGHWLRLTLPLDSGQAAYLRVAYRDGEGADRIDPAHTRLVLQLDLEDGRSLEVDLSVVERQVGAWIRASDEALRACAEAELTGLAEGLSSLGFNLKTARCEIDGRDHPVHEVSGSPRPVDVEA